MAKVQLRNHKKYYDRRTTTPRMSKYTKNRINNPEEIDFDYINKLIEEDNRRGVKDWTSQPCSGNKEARERRKALSYKMTKINKLLYNPEYFPHERVCTRFDAKPEYSWGTLRDGRVIELIYIKISKSINKVELKINGEIIKVFTFPHDSQNTVKKFICDYIGIVDEYANEI